MIVSHWNTGRAPEDIAPSLARFAGWGLLAALAYSCNAYRVPSKLFTQHLPAPIIPSRFHPFSATLYLYIYFATSLDFCPLYRPVHSLTILSLTLLLPSLSLSLSPLYNFSRSLYLCLIFLCLFFSLVYLLPHSLTLSLRNSSVVSIVAIRLMGIQSWSYHNGEIIAGIDFTDTKDKTYYDVMYVKDILRYTNFNLIRYMQIVLNIWLNHKMSYDYSYYLRLLMYLKYLRVF